MSEYERQYEDGSDPRVLDIIDITLVERRPNGHQAENWLFDPDKYWVKVGECNWTDLGRFTQTNGPLWINNHHTYHGQNDEVPVADAAAGSGSLRLVHVDAVHLKVFTPGAAFGNPKRRVQGRFRFDGNDYALWITDPRIERLYLAQPDGDHDLGESYLTISLGEPYQGACYKLIAAVSERGGQIS